MGNNLYVGGLPYSVTDARLQELFSRMARSNRQRVFQISLRVNPEVSVLSR